MTNQEIARQIAEELFTNGNSEAGDRLVLVTKHGDDLGGWGFEPVVTRITKILDEARPKQGG